MLCFSKLLCIGKNLLWIPGLVKGPERILFYTKLVVGEVDYPVSCMCPQSWGWESCRYLRTLPGSFPTCAIRWIFIAQPSYSWYILLHKFDISRVTFPDKKHKISQDKFRPCDIQWQRLTILPNPDCWVFDNFNNVLMFRRCLPFDRVPHVFVDECWIHADGPDSWKTFYGVQHLFSKLGWVVHTATIFVMWTPQEYWDYQLYNLHWTTCHPFRQVIKRCYCYLFLSWGIEFVKQ